MKWRWSICMITILALGVFAASNRGGCLDTLPVQDWEEETAKTTMKERVETTANTGPVGKDQTEPQRGVGRFLVI